MGPQNGSSTYYSSCCQEPILRARINFSQLSSDWKYTVLFLLSAFHNIPDLHHLYQECDYQFIWLLYIKSHGGDIWRKLFVYWKINQKLNIVNTSVFEIIGKSHYRGQKRTQCLRCAILWQNVTWFLQYFWISENV